jgi:hypothetical protein
MQPTHPTTPTRTPRSYFTLQDAKTILTMEDLCCYDVGYGPDTSGLLRQIADQHPQLVQEFDFINWPDGVK